MTVLEKLKQQYKCPIWMSRDETLVPLVQMEEGHLLNAHKKLMREIANRAKGETEIVGHGYPATVIRRQWRDSITMAMWLGAITYEKIRRGI